MNTHKVFLAIILIIVFTILIFTVSNKKRKDVIENAESWMEGTPIKPTPLGKTTSQAGDRRQIPTGRRLPWPLPPSTIYKTTQRKALRKGGEAINPLVLKTNNKNQITKALNKELNKAKKEITQIKEEKRKTTEVSSYMCENLKQENITLTNKNESLEYSNNKQANEIDKLNNEIDKLNNEIDELNYLNESLRRLATESNDQNRILKRNERDSEANVERIDELNNSIDKLSNEKNALINRNSSLNYALNLAQKIK